VNTLFKMMESGRITSHSGSGQLPRFCMVKLPYAQSNSVFIGLKGIEENSLNLLALRKLCSNGTFSTEYKSAEFGRQPMKLAVKQTDRSFM
jgi:hypothetical protein